MIDGRGWAGRALLVIFLLSTIHSPSSAVSAAEDLTTLQAAFLRGQYEEVLSGAQARLRQPGEPRDTLLYLAGLSALKLRDLDRAASHLQEILTEHPGSRWLPYAWMALGDTWQAAGQQARALEVHESHLRSGRAGPVQTQVTLRMAELQRKLGLWQKAKASLQDLAVRSPATPEAARARQMLHSGAFHFSVQVGAFVDRSNAAKLQEELNRRGYESQLVEAATQGRLFHRVWVGRFSERAEADETARRLNRDGFPARVVP